MKTQRPAPAAARHRVTANERAIVAPVESQVTGYFDAVRRRDVAWLLGFWTDDPQFVIAGDGKLVAGYTAGVAQPSRDFFAGLAKVLTASCRNGHPYALSPDAAVHTTEYEWSW